MARFTLPRDLYFGKGCMEDVLKNLKGKKAIIVVGGGSMKRFGFLDKAVNALKEGISNGLRHGGATAFYFELHKEGNRVNFLLSDNGTGTDINSLKEGFGLTGMHARAESLGGSVYFETEPDEGFEIHLTLPADAAK